MCGEKRQKGDSLFCFRGGMEKWTRTSSNLHRRTEFKTPHPMFINLEKKRKVNTKSVEEITGQVTGEEKVTDHELKDLSKVTIAEPTDVGIGKTQSNVDASANNLHSDRLSSVDSDHQNAEDHRSPEIIPRSLSSSTKVGLLLKKESSSTISLNEIELGFSSGSTNRLEGKNYEPSKPLSVRLGELVDGYDVKPIERVNECQLPNPGKNSLDEAMNHQSPEKICGKSRTSSEPEGSTQFNKQWMTPNKHKAFSHKTAEDSQKKKVGDNDTPIFDVVSQLDQLHHPSTNSIREQDVKSLRSLGGIISDEIRSPMLSTSICSQSERKPHSFLSTTSVTPSEIFDRHEALSIHDIFSTTIENEIPMTHDYFSPLKHRRGAEFPPAAEKIMRGTGCDKVRNSCSSSSEKISGTDRIVVSTNNSRPLVISMDHIYLNNGSESGRDDYDDNKLKAEKVAVHEDKSAEDSSWFSPIYGMIGKLI